MISVLWIIAISGLISSLGFVAKSEEGVVANSLNISIVNNDENLFLTETDVRRFLADRQDSLLSNSYRNIRIPEIERALNTHPAIENAEVSRELNGAIRIEIRQRTPVLRIINNDGESYYLDSQARLMPLSDNYTARVLVANGEINEPFARRYQLSIDQIKKSELFSSVSLLDDLWDVTIYINNDSTLSSLVQQIYVNRDHELELYPAVGNHRIVFGDASHIAEKFNKLKLFYTQGLNKSDGWNKYSTINLKYKNLVVCTKK